MLIILIVIKLIILGKISVDHQQNRQVYHAAKNILGQPKYQILY